MKKKIKAKRNSNKRKPILKTNFLEKKTRRKYNKLISQKASHEGLQRNELDWLVPSTEAALPCCTATDICCSRC